MNGKVIPNEQINALLDLADWAPTHGRTEPWRFFIYTSDALKNFGQLHGDLYWQHTPEDKRSPDGKTKLAQAVEKASHLLIAAVKTGTNPKIPILEEIAAASAAIQNLLLGASALGIAAIWNSGGMTFHPALKQELGLAEQDLVLGLIYLGYTDELPREGKRNLSLEHKVKWMK